MTSTGRPNYFMYFQGSSPAHYRWSSGMASVLGFSPWGGSEIGDADRVGRRLLDHVGDDERWFQEWTAMGDELRGIAERELGSGHDLTAAGAYLRACSYYLIGERFHTPKDEVGLAAFSKGVDSFRRYAELTNWPRIECVEVPYEDGSLPAYLVHADRSEPGSAPCVVYFDGLDITKELQFVRGLKEIVRRGVSALVIDGPGTGEAIRFRGYPLRHDYEVAGAAAINYLETRPEIASDRIGVMGVSLGGYYAPRCASMEHRFKACVAWGAIWDYEATWRKRIESEFNTPLSVAGNHISWIFGVDTSEQALEALKGFPLDGVVQKMRCPFLLLQGEEDLQIPMADAEALFAASGSEDKTMRVFTVEEGGAQHTQRDHQTNGITTIADWLAEKL